MRLPAGDEGEEPSGDVEGGCDGVVAKEAPACDADDESSCAASPTGGGGAAPNVGVGSEALMSALDAAALSNSSISSRSACTEQRSQSQGRHESE
jgi:hypothetical protein